MMPATVMRLRRLIGLHLRGGLGMTSSLKRRIRARSASNCRRAAAGNPARKQFCARRAIRCPREQQLKGRRTLPLGDQRFIGAQNQLRAVTDFDQIHPGANRRNRGLFDGHELQNAAHLHIVGEDDSPIADAVLRSTVVIQ